MNFYPMRRTSKPNPWVWGAIAEWLLNTSGLFKFKHPLAFQALPPFAGGEGPLPAKGGSGEGEFILI